MQEVKSGQLGRIKWYSVIKNYGFLTSDEGEDIFVHHSEIVYNGGSCDHTRGICVRAMSLLSDAKQLEAKNAFSTPKFEKLLEDTRVTFRLLKTPRGIEARSVKRAL